MDRDYFQEALHTFNGGNWYGWKTHDDSGNKIPNKDRMQYKYIKIIKEGATIPSESDINAKIQEIKDAETAHTNARTTGKAKLKDGGVIIADDGNIGSASDTDALAISSAGVVTFTQKPVINSGVAIDNITIDGTEIDLSSGDLTLDVAGDIILDADGGDVKINDGGTAIAELTNSSTDFVIKSVTSDKDIIFKGNDGGAAITALTLDMSAAGAATFNNAITSGAVITSGAGLVIADTGNIGSASDTDAIAIAANGVVTFSQAPVFPDGSLAVADLDIDGATDIGADLADADLFVVDDGAGGTNRKTTAARIKTYIGAANTPAFEAHLSSNTSQLSNDTDTKITFDGEIYDSDNTFSSGRFTPAVAGKYLIYGRLMFDDTNVADNTDEHMIKIFKNGAQESVFFIYPNTNDSLITYAEVIALDDNDYIEIYAKMNNSNGGRVVKGADNSQKSSTFGAFKIIGA